MILAKIALVYWLQFSRLISALEQIVRTLTFAMESFASFRAGLLLQSFRFGFSVAIFLLLFLLFRTLKWRV